MIMSMDTLMKDFEKLSLSEKQKIFELISNSMANHAALTASQIRRIEIFLAKAPSARTVAVRKSSPTADIGTISVINVRTVAAHSTI